MKKNWCAKKTDPKMWLKIHNGSFSVLKLKIMLSNGR